ncbi:RCC1 domain-containing protein [Vagococcus sp. JNUCC 83]
MNKNNFRKLMFSYFLVLVTILLCSNVEHNVSYAEKSKNELIAPKLATDSLYNTSPTEDTDAYKPNLISAVKFTSVSNFELGGTAIDASGYVWVWGFNGAGRTGIGTTSGYLGGMKRIPFFVDNNITVKTIKSGYRQSFAITTDGLLYGWGQNNNGEIGQGFTGTEANPISTPKKIPIPLHSDEKVIIVDPRENAGGLQTTVYAVTSEGRVFAWGYGGSNLIPGYTGTSNTTPIELTDISTLGKDNGGIEDIQVGNSQVILLAKNGKVFGWGGNNYGSVGIGNTSSTSSPKELTSFGGAKVTQISLNYNQSMALTEDGKVFRWGQVYGSRSTASANFTSPALVSYDFSSAKYSPVPKKVIASTYNSSIIDQHGRIWSSGGNVFYSFMQDGPLYGTKGTTVKYDWTNPLYGKLDTWLPDLTQVPKSLGDGDTQYNTTVPKAPVFSGVTYSSRINMTLYGYEYAGVWSDIDDMAAKKHPTIYDKKYYQTVGDLKPLNDGATIGSQAVAHKQVYLIDKDGNRLVYVVRKENNASTISGNFYIAESSYDGGWFVDQHTKYDLPSGITEKTSVPAVKDDEKDWTELSLTETPNDFTGTGIKEVPYVMDMVPYESSISVIDTAGNLYKQSYNGSGNIAWGWDYMPQYDSSSNNSPRDNGLYDSYSYELMFMRGAPRVSPTTVDIKSPLNKIYKSDANQEQISDVNVILGTSTVSSQLNITINPELKEAKYVKIPYDPNDNNILNSDPTSADFDTAYDNAKQFGYESGDLIDLNGWSSEDLINTSETSSKKLKDSGNIIIKDNCILWIKTKTTGYNANIEKVTTKSYTNYYTDTTVYHNGVNINKPNEQVYDENSDYVKKTSNLLTGESPDKYGVPLDVNGDAIKEPIFGFDEVTIRAYKESDPEYLSKDINYYNFISGQDNPVVLILNESKYLDNGSKNRFIHTFEYERNDKLWITINYKGRYVGKTSEISGYTMDGLTGNETILNNQETVKKSTNQKIQTYTRTPGKVENSQPAYFTIDSGSNKNLSNNKLVFDVTSDENIKSMDIIIYYTQAEIYVRQIVKNEVEDIVVPKEGYLRLVNTDGTKENNRYNIKVVSGTDENTIDFKKARLTTDYTNNKFSINIVLPEMYKYYGYKISTEKSNHDIADLHKAPDQVLADFSSNNKYYITVYIEPILSDSDKVPMYNWDYKLNSFGNIEN